LSEHSIADLIRRAFAGGSPTDWFDAVYADAEAGRRRVPWAHMAPHPDLLAWLDRTQADGAGRRALVVGCGLGDDAEELARRGFAVTAFDIAPGAVRACRRRFPQSPVDYQTADLLDAPPAWRGVFDLVLESRTLQALPWELCAPAIHAVAACVAPGGVALVLCLGRDPDADRHGIPWPLSRVELADFERAGLREESFEDLHSEAGGRRFCVAYRRPAGG
jgi:SAM-dependent methyltransferase